MQTSDLNVVRLICMRHQIEVKKLSSVAGSFDKRIYFINNELVLRVSVASMEVEQAKFRRVSTLDLVPTVLHVGVLERKVNPLFYTLLTRLRGDDLVNVYANTSVSQQVQLGKEIALFLDNLHGLTNTAYDIGLYVPTIENFNGSWRAGHQRYWALLKQEAEDLRLRPESFRILERSFQFLEETAGVLDAQAGSGLLHNDLHPRNILLHQGRFSGVIDWECSQYGEGDFDLCHLIHWCLYPPRPDVDFRPFLGALFDASPTCTQIPNVAKRLTIYQIEHEIQQIIWQGSKAEVDRVPRILRWLDDGVNDLLRQIC